MIINICECSTAFTGNRRFRKAQDTNESSSNLDVLNSGDVLLVGDGRVEVDRAGAALREQEPRDGVVEVGLLVNGKLLTEKQELATGQSLSFNWISNSSNQ